MGGAQRVELPLEPVIVARGRPPYPCASTAPTRVVLGPVPRLGPPG